MTVMPKGNLTSRCSKQGPWSQNHKALTWFQMLLSYLQCVHLIGLIYCCLGCDAVYRDVNSNFRGRSVFTVNFYQSVRRHIPEDSVLYSYGRHNLASQFTNSSKHGCVQKNGSVALSLANFTECKENRTFSLHH